jgi:DNA-binding SARP family transcriptional activator
LGQLTLRLLGGIDVRVDDYRVAGLADTRAGFLLGYLVAERHRAHTRAELASLIWPDAPLDIGRTNLRQMLHHLRRRVGVDALDGRLVTTRDSVSFTPLAGDRIDLDELGEPHCCGDPGDQAACAEARNALWQALAVYRGPLFGRDVETALSDSALGWLVRRRGSLRQGVLAVLERMVDCLVQRGETEAAIEAIERFLAYEPFSENACRLLMHTLAEAGYQSAAIEKFDQLEERLARTLAVEPAAETRALRDWLAGVPGETGTAEVELPIERRFLTMVGVWVAAQAAASVEQRAAAVTTARKRVRAALERHRGHVVVAHGGLLFAYFGYPAPLERTVPRSAQAALAAIDMAGPGVRAGASVAAASTITGSDPDLPDPAGELSARGAALAAHAESGQLLVDESARTRLDARFRTIPLPATAVGHLAYRVEAVASPEPGRSRMPLVGRDRESVELFDAWRQAAGGRPVSVFLRGPAGIGKTRLVAAITDAAAADHARVFTIQAGPEDGVRGLGPLADFIDRLLLERCEGGGSEAKLRYLTACVGDGDEAADTVDALAGLLGLSGPSESPGHPDPHRAYDRIVASINRLMRRLLERPAVLVYEDVHWADPTSEDWLRNLPAALAGLPVLLVATARPEADSPWPDNGCLVIEPQPLGPEAAAALVRHHEPAARLDREVVDRIVTRAAGVPLFLEGLARLADPGPDTAPELPASVQELLLTRLERLGSARTLAETAAALGEVFNRPELVAAVADEIPDVDEALTRLLDAGILAVDADGRRYRWRHAVYREAAYGALPNRRASELHARIADLLLDRGIGPAAPAPVIVAHHLEAAGRTGVAAGYRLRAGDHALVAGAAREAADNFRQALEDTRSADESAAVAMDARIGLGMACLAIHGYGSRAVEEAFRGALELPGVTENPRRYGRILWGLWMCASSFHGFGEAQRLAREMAQLADRNDDLGLKVAAHAARCTNELFAGTVTAAIEQGRRAQAIYTPSDHRMLATRFGDDPGITCRAVTAWALWLAGEVAAARTEIEAAMIAADRAGHAPTCGFVHTLAAVLAQRAGDAEGAAAAAQRVLAHVGESRYPLWTAAAVTLGSWARVSAGEPAAVTAIEDVVARIDSVMEGSATTFRLILADAQRQAGAFERAWATTQTTLAGIDTVGDEGLRAEVHIQRGRLAAAGGDMARARRELTRVDECAHTRGARIQQLEAAAVRATLADATPGETAAAREWHERLGEARFVSHQEPQNS